jgi:hypothetical protein
VICFEQVAGPFSLMGASRRLFAALLRPLVRSGGRVARAACIRVGRAIGVVGSSSAIVGQVAPAPVGDQRVA